MQSRTITPGNAPRIVVVDDDDSMRHALDRILRIKNYTPIIYSTAEALLETGVPPDTACLILDVRLPGFTGFDLYQQLARTGQPPPVIFITAYDEPESRTRGESLGAIDYLLKPFSSVGLFAAIDRALAVRSPHNNHKAN